MTITPVPVTMTRGIGYERDVSVPGESGGATSVASEQGERKVAVPAYQNGNAFTVLMEEHACAARIQVDVIKLRRKGGYWDEIGKDDPKSGILRVPYYPCTMWGKCAPFDEEVMKACPEQLKAIGVSETTWNQFATILHEKINMNFEPPCPGGIVMLICGVVSLGLCFPKLCKEQSRRVAVFDKNFRVWTDSFNRKVLEPRGVFLKPQSISWMRQAGDNGQSREYERWLSFGFGPEARLNLERQPHLDGHVEHWAICGGPNEAECIIHP